MRTVGLIACLAVGLAGCRKPPQRSVQVGEVGVEAVYTTPTPHLAILPPGRDCTRSGPSRCFTLPTRFTPKYNVATSSRTADGVNVALHYDLLWRVNPEQAGALVASLSCARSDDVWQALRLFLNDASQRVLARFTLSELGGPSMGLFLDEMAVTLAKSIPAGIEVAALTLNHKPGISVGSEWQMWRQALRRIEARTTRILEAERAAARLDEKRQEGEINRLYGKGLTAEMVELERAKRWDGKLPFTLTTGSPGPFAMPYQ